MLRMIPNLLVFRPADAIETAEAWAIALAKGSPTVLALTRQNLPPLRFDAEMKSAKGAYRLVAAEAARKVVLLATGSEVALAGRGRHARSAGHRRRCRFGPVLGTVRRTGRRLPHRSATGRCAEGLDRGRRHAGLAKYVGDGLTIGMDTFGASAPAAVRSLRLCGRQDRSQILSRIS
jgi:transketolase